MPHHRVAVNACDELHTAHVGKIKLGDDDVWLPLAQRLQRDMGRGGHADDTGSAHRVGQPFGAGAVGIDEENGQWRARNRRWSERGAWWLTSIITAHGIRSCLSAWH